MTRRLLVAVALVAGGCSPGRPQAPPPPPAPGPVADHLSRAEASRSRPYNIVGRTSTPNVAIAPTVTLPLKSLVEKSHPVASSVVAKAAHPPTSSSPATGYGYGPAELGRFTVTCYGPPQFPAGKHTATGAPVGPGSVAVDRRVIALGTRLRLEGIGDAVANDTGSAVKGRHLDLWRPDCRGWTNPTVKVSVGY